MQGTLLGNIYRQSKILKIGNTGNGYGQLHGLNKLTE
jgi:hypothetical protein